MMVSLGVKSQDPIILNLNKPMAINFPTSPTTNDTHTENNLNWKFNGTSWIALPTPSVAGNVAYTPAGTGAVTTDVETKLRESVSVKDFGAVGNGVADDTAAIQAAIDYAESLGGGSVILPIGTYKLTSNILIDGDHVGIVGLSRGATILSDFDGNVIDVGGSLGAKTKGNFIESVTFTETSYSRTIGNPFIKIEQAESVVIRDVAFDSVTSPVYQNETLNVQFQNVHIKAHKGTAMEWRNSVDTWVTTLHIIGDNVDPSAFVTSTEIRRCL